MTDLGIWHNKLDHVYDIMYEIRVLISLCTMRFVYLFIDPSKR